MRTALLVFCAIALCGCEDLGLGPTDSGTDTVELQRGGSAWLPSSLTLITFDDVQEDSRCPIDAMCVWAGDATAKLRIRQLPSGEQPFELHTTLNPKSYDYRSLTIRIISLTPLPRTGTTIDPSQYRVTLEIKREKGR